MMPIVEVVVMKITFAQIKNANPKRRRYFRPKMSASAPIG